MGTHYIFTSHDSHFVWGTLNSFTKQHLPQVLRWSALLCILAEVKPFEKCATITNKHLEHIQWNHTSHWETRTRHIRKVGPIPLNPTDSRTAGSESVMKQELYRSVENVTSSLKPPVPAQQLIDKRHTFSSVYGTPATHALLNSSLLCLLTTDRCYVYPCKRKTPYDVHAP